MLSRFDRLRLALGALDLYRTGSRLGEGIRRGLGPVDDHWASMTAESHDRLLGQVDHLHRRGVDVAIRGDGIYSSRLDSLRSAPPMLFLWGNLELLDAPAIGMCGSRDASPKGLDAARACGLEVASHGLVVVSGYAKGVDTETHLAGLRSGGRTVIVLAEGILHFRPKRVFDDLLDPDHALVISQFPPSQRWTAGAAMTRNSVIAGLGRALVVVEAGAKGGTLNAGLTALEMRRPVLALEFSDGTPAGNELLFARGAIRVRSKEHLGRVLRAIEEDERHEPSAEQLSLL